jgi:hypothetical protein
MSARLMFGSAGARSTATALAEGFLPVRGVRGEPGALPFIVHARNLLGQVQQVQERPPGVRRPHKRRPRAEILLDPHSPAPTRLALGSAAWISLAICVAGGNPGTWSAGSGSRRSAMRCQRHAARSDPLRVGKNPEPARHDRLGCGIGRPPARLRGSRLGAPASFGRRA